MTLLPVASAGGLAGPAGIALTQQPVPPEDPGGQGPDAAKAAPAGLVVLLLFFIAVALLVRSMNKHLRRIPASFDKPESFDKPGKPDESPRD
ncbi:MAG: hypothetical protein ABR608_11060 [Pseudonocardiaceae bacterium]